MKPKKERRTHYGSTLKPLCRARNPWMATKVWGDVDCSRCIEIRHTREEAARRDEEK